MNSKLDTIVFGTKKAFDTVGRKTGEAVVFSKKQVEKVQLKNKFQEKQLELGRLCYEMHETNIDHTGSMKRLIIELEDIEQQIRYIDEAVGTPVECRFCGTKNSSSNDYCTKCGERLK